MIVSCDHPEAGDDNAPENGHTADPLAPSGAQRGDRDAPQRKDVQDADPLGAA